MVSFAALLSQKQPQFQTHQALVILGMQNEFLSPEGKLPISTESGFVDRVKELVPKFRELAGDIIWVRSEFQGERNVNDGAVNGEVVMTELEEKEEAPRENGQAEPPNPPPVSSHSAKKNSKSRKKAMDLVKKLGARKSLAQLNPSTNGDKPEEPKPKPKVDQDEELFLSYTPKDGPYCEPNSTGAEFPKDIKDCIDAEDTTIVTSHYSAFNQTSLLKTLRMKLITELYICGCITNLSVYATAADAARHGLTINIIEDCLGFRTQSRHEAAMKAMTIMMGAYTVESADIMWDLNHPPDGTPGKSGNDGLNEALEKMSLNEKPSSSKSKGKSKGEPPDKQKMEELEQALAKIAINRDRNKGKTLVSEAALLGSTEENNGDASFHRKVRQYASQPDLGKGYMKSRIRMRPRAADKSKAAEEQDEVKKRPTTSGGPSTADRENSSLRGSEIKSAKAATSKTTIPAAAEKPTHESRSVAGRPNNGSAPTPAAGISTERASSTEQKPGQSSRSRSSKLSATSRGASKSQSMAESEPSVPPVPQIRTNPVEHSSFTNMGSTATPKPAEAKSDTQRMSTKKQKGLPPDLSNLPTLGPADRIGEGDTYIKHDLLPDSVKDPISGQPLSSNVFHALYHEVKWQKMYHVGGEVPRLVAIQGAVDANDGSKPIYRHPSDQSPPLLPFTNTVDIVRKEAEKVVGHELNHVLIQLYRQGEDYISEHSDKTLDIARGSSIVNASFGARRTMRLRTKKSYKPQGGSTTSGTLTAKENNSKLEAESGNKGSNNSASDETDPEQHRTTQRIPLPHNSIFVLGQLTNALWLHAIPQDKRAAAQKAPEERAYNGMRISLTFRRIATFLSADESLIWGQGARAKNKDDARPVISGDEMETQRMVRAFGRENHEAGERWKEWYGEGFDVLHFTKV